MTPVGCLALDKILLARQEIDRLLEVRCVVTHIENKNPCLHTHKDAIHLINLY